MKTYVAILRGINVLGHKVMKMDKLRKAFEVAGYEDVRTYVQSGNVVFKGKESPFSELERSIYELIRSEFGFEVPVIVLDREKLKRVMDHNPFASDSDKDTRFMHVTYLRTRPEKMDYEGIESKKAQGEAIAFTDEAVYLYCPKGYGKTKVSNNLIEDKLKVNATTRNWNTTLALYEMTRGQGLRSMEK